MTAASAPHLPAHTRWWAIPTILAVVVLGPAGAAAVLALALWDLTGRPTSRRVLLLGALGLAVVAQGWLVAGVPGRFELGAFAAGSRGWLDALTRAAIGVVAVGALGGSPTMRVRPDLPATGTRGARGLADRLPEVDRLRAVAIVTVVLIHTLPFRAPTTGYLDWWLGDVTRFAVPVLLFASGWLVPRRRVGLDWLRRRLRRLVPPYLVGSVVMLLVSSVSPLLDRRPVAQALLLGDAVGIYYFVVVLIVLTMLVPAVQRLSSRGQVVLLALAAAVSLAIEVADLSIYLHNHLPLTWLPYLLAGMVLRPHRDRLRANADQWVLHAGAVLGIVLVGMVLLDIHSPARQVATWVGIWAAGATLLLAALAARSQPTRTTATLSRLSYPIYLYHLPVVAGLVGTFGTSILSGRPLVAVPLTLVVAVGTIWLVHAIWPDHAEGVLGG